MIKIFIRDEIKRKPLFFSLLFLTLFFSLFGIFSLKFVSEQVKDKINQNAKTGLTSDLSLSLRQPLSESDLQRINQTFARIPSYQVVDIYSMVSFDERGELKLVELRGIENGYPFYGAVTPSMGIFDPEKVYVSDDLSSSAKDFITINGIRLKIDGLIKQDTSVSFRGFSLAPRVYVPLRFLKENNLLSFGTTGNFSVHFKTNESLENLNQKFKQLLNGLDNKSLKLTTPQSSSEQLSRVIDNFTRFIVIAGFVGVILGGIGLIYLYQSYLRDRLKDFFMMHLCGMSLSSMMKGLLLQFSICYFTVVAIVYTSFSLLSPYLGSILERSVGLSLTSDLTIKAIVVDVLLFYVLGLSFFIPLVLSIRKLDQKVLHQKYYALEYDKKHFVFFSALLYLLCLHYCASISFGSVFFAFLVIVWILSFLFMRLGTFGFKKLQRNFYQSHSLKLNLAVKYFIISSRKQLFSFLTLTLASSLIIFITQMNAIMQNELSVDKIKPSLFLFDIQEEQVTELKELAKEHRVPLVSFTPMIRARLEKVNGKRFKKDSSKDRFSLERRESESQDESNSFNLTYRREVTFAEKIVSGESFPEISDPDRMSFVSLERRFAQRQGLKIGDVLQFDVQGIPFEAKVLNLRSVRWASFYPNFFINVEPGMIELAPKTFLAVVEKTPENERNIFLHQMNERFKNISLVKIDAVVEKLSDLFGKVKSAIVVMTLLCLFVSAILIYAFNTDQLLQRFYDLSLLKNLGFSRSDLMKILYLESLFLILLSLVLSSFLGLGFVYFLSTSVFQFDFILDEKSLIFALVSLCLFSLIVKWPTTQRALGKKSRELSQMG